MNSLPTRQYFGTDGIRGQANQHPMTADIAMKVAMAAAKQLRHGSHRHRVVIAKDTRLSGYMLEPAMVAGFTAMGMDVLLTGPVPTPAVAWLVRSMRADLGVMISASHNLYQDNGIKLFGPDGFKLSDLTELEIEAQMQADLSPDYATADTLGRAQRLDDSLGRYIEAVKSAFPKKLSLNGLKVVVDCANGAAYKSAPTVLWELGAEAIPLNVTPNGVNINAECGATSPAAMCQAVLDHGADIGLALDGDADRVIIADANGHIIDGDKIMALIATFLQDRNQLRGCGVAATVMSNLGLERYLKDRGIRLFRTNVGDRYVVKAMREKGLNLGGEQSGHIVLGDHATTGDGLAAALQVLAALVASDKPLAELAHVYGSVPQKLTNVRYKTLDQAAIDTATQQAMQLVNTQGRVVVRRSGTEPLLRIMVEAETEQLIQEATAMVRAVVDEKV
ncbi:phosphoglucosamine mutase [Leptolyngbya cf. ectocarpi LEGE 11479]|uniref:Phosphoglucosamine mutase n=1 Tax=Leptolyngbya cf. ectocarpi LEGE 11479 TaxID=1828722 RepID=A0A928ZTN0_LEPEC|nr:phosphoglucosamine mutase [Leptolyngbya ectocarpi]MBE9066329.1 phosphoglucosamine mutase [Leptolyngbya cf. ectocarpi LEGE 11479]